MWTGVTLSLEGIFLCFGLWNLVWTAVLEGVDCLPATAVLLDAAPVEVRKVLYDPNHSFKRKRAPGYYMHVPQPDYYEEQEPVFSEEDSFVIEPDDAVTGNKYSNPVAGHHPELRRRYRENSSSHTLRDAVGLQDKSSSSSGEHGNRSVTKSIETVTGTNGWSAVPVTVQPFHEVTVTSDYQVEGVLSQSEVSRISDRKQRRSDPSIQPHLSQNNFTDVNDSHVLVPSDAVLQYQPHPVIPKNDTPKNISNEQIKSTTLNVPSSTQNVFRDSRTTEVPLTDAGDLERRKTNRDTHYRTETTIDLFDPNVTTDRTVYFVENQTSNVLFPSDSKGNSSVSVLPPGNTKAVKLSSGTVVGIVIGVLTCVTLLTSSVIYLLYRRYNGKCTGVGEGKFNSDNCGYLDDSLRSSVYLNNHIELPKENSEEMTSLDNDSFLNSLETMTIQNYWADNTKNTKV